MPSSSLRAARLRLGDLGLHGVEPLGQLGDPLLRGLAALHDVEDHVLQVALPLGEGGELALEVLQVLGRGDRAGVEALLVAGGALPYLVDVLLGLGLLASGVALLGLRGDEQVAQFGEVRGQPLDLGVLGEVLALVVQLLQTLVEGLDFEKTDLVGGLGVQFGAPGLLEGDGVGGTGAGGAGAAVTGRIRARARGPCSARAGSTGR